MAVLECRPLQTMPFLELPVNANIEYTISLDHDFKLLIQNVNWK